MDEIAQRIREISKNFHENTGIFEPLRLRKNKLTPKHAINEIANNKIIDSMISLQLSYFLIPATSPLVMRFHFLNIIMSIQSFRRPAGDPARGDYYTRCIPTRHAHRQTACRCNSCTSCPVSIVSALMNHFRWIPLIILYWLKLLFPAKEGVSPSIGLSLNGLGEALAAHRAYQ